MANLDVYPEIPSPSGGSFRTLEDDAIPTPRRTGTPVPSRHVDERSRLLDRSLGDGFVEYSAEQAVDRRRPSTYTVIGTGSTSGVGSSAVPRTNGDGVAGQSGPSKPEARKPPTGNWRKRLSYYVPVTSWAPGYSLSFLGGDFLAGLTVACILIPQSVSYGTSLAKLDPTAGLFSASIPGIFYAMLGSSRQLNVGPEAALSLLVGQAITDVMHNNHENPEDFLAVGYKVATAITLQSGLFSFLLGFFRLGFIDVILSRALLTGFVGAVGIVILIEQLIPMLGLIPLEKIHQPKTTIGKLFFLIENVPDLHGPTAMVAFGAFGALVLLRFFKGLFKSGWIRGIPEVLIVVVVSTYLSARFHWDEQGVDILGRVSVNIGSSLLGFPLSAENRKYFSQTTSTAILASVMGFLDSIVSAKQNATRFQYSISPNRELVALGVANLAGSFVPGALVAAGSITKSRISGDVGARTQMASLVCSGVVLLATFFLLPWLYYLPKGVLASIVCLVLISILTEMPESLEYYWRMRSWIDLALMLLTFTLTIGWSVEVGVAVSIVISLLLVIHRSSKARLMILGRIPGTDRWKPISEDPEAMEDSASGTLIIRIRENLDFANTAQLKERLRRLELYGHGRSHPSDEPSRPQATVLIFHMADVETIDASAVDLFHELVETYKNRGVGVFITHLRIGPYKMFERGGIVELIGHQSFYSNVATAVAQVQNREAGST